MEQIINTAAELIVNKYFGIILAIIILLSPIWLKKIKTSSQIQIIVTTAGMFGTFLGIVAGISLLELGIKEINGSITNLLGGLTTAFLTSIAGLLASLIIQVRPHGFPYNINENESEGTIQEISLGDVLSELKSLNKNIAGEGDASLTTQIQKMRIGIVDKQDELNKAFKKFSEQMVDSNIDALAKAIEKVMGDFNTTVNEKLGEAFDNFRKAIENLNQWQSEYKDQITSQTEGLKVANSSFTTAVESMLSMKESFEGILDIKKKFDELLISLNANLEGSLGFASSMKELSADLDGAGKMIKEEMKDITHGAANEMEKTMNKTLADFGSNLADISGKMAEDFRQIQQILENRNN